jgi:hypothetical protein
MKIFHDAHLGNLRKAVSSQEDLQYLKAPQDFAVMQIGFVNP